MKKCIRCGKKKPESSFYAGRGDCKECHSIYIKEWKRRRGESYRQKRNEESKAYYRKNFARISEKERNHPERKRRNALAYYYRLQEQAIRAYGGHICACCKETEPLFMTLDHIENNGRDHRKEFDLRGAKLYKWLKDRGYPPGFQVLCTNCNHGKYRNNGVCPHRG